MEKETKALEIITAADIKVVLRNGLAATANRANGAINVWLDHNTDLIRCQAMRHRVDINRDAFIEVFEAVQWAKEWLKKIK